MSNTVKERLADELQKAKAAGSLRTGRIQEIVRSAIAQTVAELKEGAVEIRSIAQETVGVVVGQVKEQSEKVKADLTASIEEFIEENRPPLDPNTDAAQDLSNTPSSPLTVEAKPDAAGSLLVLPSQPAPTSKTFKSLFQAALRAIRQRQEWTGLQERYRQLHAKLGDLDGQLTERYGDRYRTLKRQIHQQRQQAQTWYQATKAKVEAGESHVVQQNQADLEQKASDLGATIAQTETVIKQQLKQALHSAFQR